MRNADGWLGTRELPGFRAGNVIAKLDDLPEVDPRHFYVDVLLLGDGGRIQDNDSGPCRALARAASFDARSCFVRVLAELVRHASGDPRGLAVVGPALSFVRESGISFDRLTVATQMLDNGCSERVVSDSLDHLLEHSLGEAEAQRVMSRVVTKVACVSGFGSLDEAAADPSVESVGDFDSRVRDINEGGLSTQVSFVVRSVGKTRARRYLRQVTSLQMVPVRELFLS